MWVYFVWPPCPRELTLSHCSNAAWLHTYHIHAGNLCCTVYCWWLNGLTSWFCTWDRNRIQRMLQWKNICKLGSIKKGFFCTNIVIPTFCTGCKQDMWVMMLWLQSNLKGFQETDHTIGLDNEVSRTTWETQKRSHHFFFQMYLHLPLTCCQI